MGGSDQAGGESCEKERSPFTKPGFIASAVGIGLIAVLGGVVVLTGPDDKKTDDARPVAGAPSASASPAAPSARPSSSSGTSSCPELQDTDTSEGSVLDLRGSGLSWKKLGPLNLPLSQRSGPAVTDGQVVRCFAHTPRGAVLALANISVRSANGPGWRAVVEQQVYPDDAKAVYEQSVAANRSDWTSDYPPEFGLPQLAGYKLISYSSDTAVVDFVFQTPGGKVLSMPLTARWHEGDWKQKMSPDGGQTQLAASKDTTDGYVLFPRG
ncbi:hypothetical protein MHW47_08920 [Streptomyces sp. OfavH-34-F]|uniref:hypothetical protein n=1 Tax=Streptomyces sp. OfavH-34-F TaxID=2917760 RepID=UPI001EF3CBDC|nr:hypothetical protein [Streptomyces sp. OfavH-34-F]MCG7524556.1 hypothetical protein [Streptomyces sp. OfavH-34-F]